MKSRIIRAAFFRRDPIGCARELVGAELIWGKCAGKIVETEAYLAENDEACHTFSRPTARAFIERNRAGAAYIYFSYGAHWMLNVLVKGATNGFVLIRAVQPLRGMELMKKRRGVDDERRLCSGPGKLTQAFDITNRHHEMNLCVDPRHCFAHSSDDHVDVIAGERIGITRSAHHPWRFTMRTSKFVSVPVRSLTRSAIDRNSSPR
ncbi:MAG TPA: DNA-3-methyladenine glycosylase [Chthoniobacterales bacterium]|nr:DNA-3-methyladenine glycosylase [Chthoniobacterales bacterium]